MDEKNNDKINVPIDFSQIKNPKELFEKMKKTIELQSLLIKDQGTMIEKQVKCIKQLREMLRIQRKRKISLSKN